MTDGIAHVFNRGIEKGVVFADEQDYERFVKNLYRLNNRPGALRIKNNEFPTSPPPQDPLVEILRWSLLPNHYHLLLLEKAEGGIVEFAKRIGNGYTKYFNTRYNRSGYLFQNAAKMVPIENDAQFLYIPIYIDLNPLDLFEPNWKEHGVKDPERAFDFLENYPWLSFCKAPQGAAAHITNTDSFYELFETNERAYRKSLYQWLAEGPQQDYPL